MAEASAGGKTSLPDIDLKDGRFPSDLVNPEEKTTLAYQLRYFKAAFYLHKRNGGIFSTTRREDWVVNKAYADGNQSNKKYIGLLTKLKDNEERPLSYMDLDWSIVSVLPKVRDVVLSIIRKQRYDIFCDAINPIAAKDREISRARLWAQKVLQPFLGQQSEKAGVNLGPQPGDFIPETVQELDTYMQNGFRLPYEAAMEMLIQGVKYENLWEEEAKLIDENFFDLGVAGACDDIDRFNHKITLRATDPINMILMDFHGHDGREMSRIGEIRKMTIAQIRLSAGNQFTEEQYYDMVKAYAGYWNNPVNLVPYADYINTDNTYGKYRDYDTAEVYVMDMDYDSLDVLKWEDSYSPSGDLLRHRRDYTTAVGKKSKTKGDNTLLESEVVATETKTVYTGKWIIGTELMWDYGKLNNIVRDIFNPKICYKRFKFYRQANKSMLERCLPYLDSLQLSWLKIQNLKARAMPKGLMIEIGAFDNVFLDNKKMTARELLEMAVQTGIIVWRKNSTMDDDGYDNTTGPPIVETEGGLGAEYRELLDSMMNDIAMIREVTGINDTVAASDPNPNQLVGVAQFANQGALNAIHPLVAARISLENMISKSILLKAQLIAKYTGKFTSYLPIIGQAASKWIEIAAMDATTYAFDTRVVYRPTDEAKQRMLVAAEAALKSSQDPSGGGIEFSDYLMIVRLIENDTDLKTVEMILNDRINKFKAKMQALSAQSSKENAQNLAMVEEAKTKAKLMEMQAETVETNKRYRFQIDEDIRYEKEVHNLTIKENTHKSVMVREEKKAENNLGEIPTSV